MSPSQVWDLCGITADMWANLAHMKYPYTAGAQLIMRWPT